MRVELRRAAVEDCERGCLQRQTGHRPDRERGADHYEHPGGPGKRCRTLDDDGVELLAEHDDPGLEHTAATGTERDVDGLELPRHRARRLRERAGGADRLSQRPVELDDVQTPRPLVEPVDVLGQDRAHQPVPFELGEREMAGVGLNRGQECQPAAVELPNPFRIGVESVDRRDLGRVVARPDTRSGAEVRDPRLGAQTGPAETTQGCLARISSASSRASDMQAS